jgi:alpha-L-arabinofuranosidase
MRAKARSVRLQPDQGRLRAVCGSPAEAGRYVLLKTAVAVAVLLLVFFLFDAIATRSGDGERLYVKAVNTSRVRALTMTVTVTGTRVGASGTIQTIIGDAFEAANSFRTPEAVTVRTRSIQSGSAFTVDLPPHSVSVLTLPRN